MKGIAITLATREESDAVASIEKLTGAKIARIDAGVEGTKEPARETKRAPREKREERPQRAERAKSSSPTDQRKDRPSPVVEDIKPDWNGPLPSFLAVSAGA